MIIGSAISGGGGGGNVMDGESQWVTPGIDTKRANVARVYDYLLGGTHNFLADQDVARTMIAVDPAMRDIARANRDFLGRAVRFCAANGIRQFLDIGSGIPTEGNVHEVAEKAAPGARVVYVDSDEVAVAHSRLLLAGNENTGVLQEDLRSPEAILASEVTTRLLDLSEPVALILAAVLHFIPDSQDPRAIVATLVSRLAPGSYLVISHGTNDGNPVISSALDLVYNRNVASSAHIRSGPEILRFFDGLDVVPPGLVTVPNWRPDPPGPPEGSERIWSPLGAVGRKP